MKSQLQQRVKRKYLTLYRRTAQAIASGQFIAYSKARKATLVQRLQRYERRLKQWGIAVASAAALFAMPMAAQAQITFTERTAGDNPFNGLDPGRHSTPTFVDMDSDGDLDLVSGERYGTFKYYRNDAGTFTEQTAGNNPLGGIGGPSPSIYSKPTFVNLDGDFDMDMVSGDYYGGLSYYRNDAGTFTKQTGSNNPLNGLPTALGNSAPTFGDLDGDGDIDLIVGEYYGGTLLYYRNDAGTFTQQIGGNNPLNAFDAGYYASPAFVDLDTDGDMDLVVGNSNGNFKYFRNDAGTFSEQTGSSNPLDGFSAVRYSTPAFADIDGDGDLDLVAGNIDGFFKYYENTSPALPVEFLHFKGHAVAQGNALQWATATEDNNEGFYVQRSSDGRRFDDIEWVAGAGTTQEVQSYAFLDREPLAGVNYYRLKQVDYDGTFAYSKVISLYQQATAGEGEPFAYPNPTRDFLTIEAPTASLATLFNALGQPLKQIPLTGSTRTLDVSDLPKGLYALQLQATDGTILRTQQVVKL